MPVAPAILIEGIGSIGGVIAAELVRAGASPVLVTGNPAITAAIRRHGLRLRTPDHSDTLWAEAHTALDELPPGRVFDSAWLIMKANGVVAAARASLPWLARDGQVVSFQNGLVEEAIATVVERRRLLRVSVAFGASMEAPGVYRRTTRRSMLYVGELDGSVTPRLTELAAALEVVVPVSITRNIAGILWGKLVWNCAVSGLCAVGGCTLGEMVGHPAGRRLFLRIYTEVIETAERLGIVLERAVVDHRKFYCPPGLDAAGSALREQAVAELALPYGAVRPSIVQSLERGRPTEIAFLNGEVVSRARAVGLALPVNSAVTRMVGEIERGSRRPRAANLDELLVACD